MATLHSIHRCGVITRVALPRVYNIPVNARECGAISKTYSLKSATKRKIKSSLQKLWYEKENRITFWTFTFGNSGELSTITSNQKVLNAYFSSLLENFKRTYGLKRYVWVSERTGSGTIHYHCAFDCPKLEKSKFQECVKYFRNSFADYCEKNKVYIDRTIQNCSIGFPKRRDKFGNYCGSVVRNVEALSNYIAGYLCKKCDRVETGGRIYAISRNCVEKPVKRMSGVDYSDIFLKFSQNFDYCSVDYFQIGDNYDRFFINERKESLNDVRTETDIARLDKMTNRKERNFYRKNAEEIKIYNNFKEKDIEYSIYSTHSKYSVILSVIEPPKPKCIKELGAKFENDGTKKGNFYQNIWKV